MATLEHKNIPDTELHPPARVAASDPGAIGAGRGWIDTSGSPYLLKIRNGTNTGWDTIGATGGGIAIGDAVGSGTSGSVLFVDGSGNLAQNNTGLKWANDAQLLVKTTAETSAGGLVHEFAGWDGSGYTTGLVIRSTSGSGYFPNHLKLVNTAYDRTGVIFTANLHGLYFKSETTEASFVFQDVSTEFVTFSSRSGSPQMAEIRANAADKKLMVLKHAASPTANFLEMVSSTDSLLSAFTAKGAWSPPTMADGDAANNTIYYSSTASKLVYKDGSGSVNALY